MRYAALLSSGGRIVSSNEEYLRTTSTTEPGELNQLSDPPVIHQQQGGAAFYHHHTPTPADVPSQDAACSSTGVLPEEACFTPDEDGDLPIHIAVAQENYYEVSAILNNMRNYPQRGDLANDLKQTPLHIAVVTGNVPIVQLLLNYGFSPAIPDRHGNTSVHLACKCASALCLEYLLSHPEAQTVINCHNYDGFSPIHLAIFRQDLNIIRTLVCTNSDVVDSTDGTSGRSPLFHAVENGFEDVVDVLVRFGANVNLPNFSGTTPLVVATDRTNQTITSILISRGAMMSCRDDS